MDGAEEVYLDANELAKPHKFFSVGQTQVSDDGKLLAFGSDVTGFREYYLSVKDLTTGKVLEDRFDQGRQVGAIARDRFAGGVLIDLLEDTAFAMCPLSDDSVCSSKTCETSPRSLKTTIWDPSATAMPAASWPRCCSA